jgi:hypothetical protein
LLLVIFQIGPPIYAQASLDFNPPVYTFLIATMTSSCHHAQLIGWNGASPTCCLGWSLSSQSLLPE